MELHKWTKTGSGPLSTLAAMDQIATPFCSAKSGLDLANFPRFDLHYKQKVS